MLSDHSYTPIKEKMIDEDKFVIFQVNANDEYVKYRAGPLYTCYSYLIFYQTKENETNAILYHAKSGTPVRLPEIFLLIKNNYQSIKDVIIAMPHTLSYPHAEKILKDGILLLQRSFQTDKISIITVEEAFTYNVDTLGNHGVLIPHPRIMANNQLIIDYLKSLKKDIKETPFTRYDFLSNEVDGKPKGVEAIENKLEPLDAVISLKSSTTPEMFSIRFAMNFQRLIAGALKEQKQQ